MIQDICALPKNVTLELTEVCNLRCRMCYFWGETGRFSNPDSDRKPMTMELDMVKRIVGELAPARPMYSLFGGEPLSYPHLEEMIHAIKGAGSFVDTPTNGTLLEKHAKLLAETGFDSIRVSLDGPREANDAQRGNGSYDKAMAGIEALHEEKKRTGKVAPLIGILYTVTPVNYLGIEKFFLSELNLSAVGWVTIQMQNFITEPMGRAYAKMLESEMGIESDRYWRGMLRSPEDFREIDVVELSRQVSEVIARLQEKGKIVLLLPKKFTPENLSAYLGARWDQMTEKYSKCPVPWNAVDITTTGDLAPCHVFFDLVTGNLHRQSFEEIWNGDKFKLFRAYIQKRGLMSICHGCCILYMFGY